MSHPENAAAAGPAQSGVLTRSQSAREEHGASMGEAHEEHQFRVKMDQKETKEYKLTCNRSCTVLQAIKSDSRCLDIYNRKEYSDSTIMIEMGEGDKDCVIPTHFPCCKIDNNALLTLCKLKVTVAPQAFLPPDQYSVFYIDTEGGENAKSKKLFTDNAFKKFKYLLVCADKKGTLEEALRRDRRFIDFRSFLLTNIEKETEHISSSQPASSVDGGRFKICLDRGQFSDKEKSPQAEKPKVERSNRKSDKGADEAAQTSEVKVKREPGCSSDTQIEEIYHRLREQFSDLKEWMESRFPGDSLPKALKLRQENFGKLQQSFAEVHQLRQVIQLGDSVCKITVESVCQGSVIKCAQHLDNIIQDLKSNHSCQWERIGQYGGRWCVRTRSSSF